MTSATSKSLLMVEGSDEKHAIKSLLRSHGFVVPSGTSQGQRDLPELQDYDGGPDLLAKVERMAKGTPRLGVVLDAEQSLAAQWKLLRTKVAPARVVLPERPDAQGTIVAGHRDGWHVGVWMMPNNIESGMLEDFLASLIPPEDRCWPHVQSSTRSARVDYGAALNPVHEAKGAIHAWLAWQEPSGKPFSTALDRGLLMSDGSLALAFVAWFERLFDVKPVRRGS